MGWFKLREVCVHCDSNTAWRDFEDQPTCGECRVFILSEREGTRHCPVDGASLVKEVSQQILLDRCPECGGVWLDAGEIHHIRNADGEFATGFVLGKMF